MKSIKLFNKVVSKFSFSFNCNRFLTQLINSSVNQMSEQNNTEEVKQCEDNIDDQQSTKRLKTEDNNQSSDAGQQEVVAGNRNEFKREKLRKWVLLLSYCGQNYYGMQRQTLDSEFPTIEQRLFESLWKSEAISEDKYKAQHLCRFQRAARTDKGVSAIKQIVSILLPIEFNEMLPKVNNLLPPEIRVIDCKRVTKFFDAKNFCDGRTYSYLMPSYALCPIEDKTNEAFRLSKEQLKEFNEILRLYLGTHNYHNFTSGKEATDASAMRYIMSMDCSQPFIKDELEFVVIRVKGQAFMLHQIRKMIGLAIAVMRGVTTKETIIRAFKPTRIDIPRAPGLGLLLEEVHYDQYNRRYGGDGIHEPITWNHKNETVDEFKHKYIYPNIVETERKERPMFEWLQTLFYHTYNEREQGVNDEEPNQDSELFRAHRKILNENSEKLKNTAEEDKEVTTEDNIEVEIKQN